jgi:hypothetical protein
VQRSKLSFAGLCGRRLLSAAVAFVLLVGSAAAQTVIVESPKLPLPPGTAGVGGGAGLVAPLPQLPTAPNLTPTLPPPLPAPVPAAPESAPRVAGPAAPARCAPDGGGDDSECCCAKDLCYDQLDPATGKSHRVCEKAQ